MSIVSMENPFHRVLLEDPSSQSPSVACGILAYYTALRAAGRDHGRPAHEIPIHYSVARSFRTSDYSPACDSASSRSAASKSISS